MAHKPYHHGVLRDTLIEAGLQTVITGPLNYLKQLP